VQGISFLIPSQSQAEKEIQKNEGDKTMATEWLKECEICNAGLCKRMDELIEEVGSERKAAQAMEAEAAKQIGHPVWTWSQIRDRYKYHKHGYHAGGIPTSQPKEKRGVEAKKKRLMHASG
jgi:hypothetical protein